MGVLGGAVGYRLLRWLAPQGHGVTHATDSSAYIGKSKLETLLGREFWAEIQDRTVIDFGCGSGEDSVEMARRGAARVFGIDIQDKWLFTARRRARAAGVEDRCTFAYAPPEPADLIVAVDSFEHFSDPGAVLDAMATMLRPGGSVIACFGPTWYHPLGGHLFSVFPWAHLLFTERALLRWRSDFKTDGARRFGEVEGGLNQMTLRRFRRLVASSPLKFEEFEAVPIRKLRWLASPLTEEFTTAVVRCRMVLRKPAAAIRVADRAKAAA